MIIGFDTQFIAGVARERNSKLALVPFGVVFIILGTFPCFLTQDVPASSCAFPGPALPELAIPQGTAGPLDFLMLLFPCSLAP